MATKQGVKSKSGNRGCHNSVQSYTSPNKKIRQEENTYSSLPEREIELIDTTEYNEESDEEEINSVENECTTPEYLEEEFLEEVDSNEHVVHETREKHLTTFNNSDKHYRQQNLTRKKKDFSPSVSSRFQSSSTNSTPKSSDILIPANINQYGECLKTRLGRYSYGLTLLDPPTQFFQGVLKGASGQTLAAIFGDISLIEKLDKIPKEDIGHFIMDTTYKVIPNSTNGVNHVFTISLLLQNQTIPLWYAITSCSSPELYKRILIEFQQHVLDWPFTSVLLNNDPALCKGVFTVFPDIDFYGSWFYYCYSIWNELSVNRLTEHCKSDSVMLLAVKMLFVITYLPSDSDCSPLTMVEGFEAVIKFAEENNLPIEFNKVLDYVATFWFNTVGTSNFTVFGKHTKAVNYVEIIQVALLSCMKPNGNVWTLTRSFQKAAKTAHLEVKRYLSGKPFLTKKNRARKYNITIRQNSKKLLSGEIDVKTFLEKSTVYCEEILDIFLHPLYPLKGLGRSNYAHINGWKIRIS